MSKKIVAEELLRCGYVNEVFKDGGGDGVSGKNFDSDAFVNRILKEVEERLTGGHLVDGSLLGIKKLIRSVGGGNDELDRVAVEEVMGGMAKFVNGVPQEEFRKIAAGEKRHKL